MDLTAQEAAAALTAAAFRVPDPKNPDQSRTVIHSLVSGYGADWNLEAAVGLLDKATIIRWEPSLIDHELVVVAGGRIHRFDAQQARHGKPAQDGDPT